jgi:hypothetical protein
MSKIFEWSDSSDEEKEDSRMLKEFRVKNVAGAAPRKIYDTREQPDFHERNKSFLEKYCTCCVSAGQSYDLSREEVR